MTDFRIASKCGRNPSWLAWSLAVVSTPLRPQDAGLWKSSLTVSGYVVLALVYDRRGLVMKRGWWDAHHLHA
ncbi:hypothetical protein AVXHC19_19630 [Acidovorax sacchari]